VTSNVNVPNPSTQNQHSAKLQLKVNNPYSERGKKNIPAREDSKYYDSTKKSKIIEDEAESIPEPLDITVKLTNSTIYCREKEQEFILNFLKAETSKTLFICGQPGTGKTSLLLEMFNNKSIELLRNPKYLKIYINCMSVNSIDDFYIEIFEFFRKLEIRKLDKILSENPNNRNLITLFNMMGENRPTILLDEVDFFYQKNKDIIFYEMLNIPYICDCDIRMIMISNNSEFDKEILPKVEDKKIKVTKYVFTPYTHVEINEIMTNKLVDMEIQKYFEEDVLRLISRKCASKTGDIRPAIEVVKNLILTHQSEFSKGKKIELKDALLIFNKKNTGFIDLMNSLTVEQRIMIVSIYFLITRKDSLEVTEKEVNIY
jgi:Cdc6-like AAA superfamily ATPase